MIWRTELRLWADRRRGRRRAVGGLAFGGIAAKVRQPGVEGPDGEDQHKRRGGEGHEAIAAAALRCAPRGARRAAVELLRGWTLDRGGCAGSLPHRRSACCILDR